MVYWNLIAFFVPLVIRRILHFLILNFICDVAAHSWSLNISFWSNLASFGQLIFRYMALSSVELRRKHAQSHVCTPGFKDRGHHQLNF